MRALSGFWVAGVFLVAAWILALNPVPYESPVVAAVPVASWVTNTSPVRHPSLTPQYQAAGYTYRCSDCHRIIPSPAETYRKLVQHTEITLRHGINTRCFNCHHRTQRDAFVDDDGGMIAWDQPQRLCARCHGPVYRDWQAGSHGRSNGYWDTTRGEQTRRKCIECHDPHAPPFPPLHPAPGPNTLRMGVPGAHSQEGLRDPLRINAQETGEPPAL